MWLQNKRDASLERSRGPSPRREDAHEYRVGRLKHERVSIPRGDDLLAWALQVMKLHAKRKSVLEVCKLKQNNRIRKKQFKHSWLQLCERW